MPDTRPDRQPTQQEAAGIAWWNSLTPLERAAWLHEAADRLGPSASAADAYAAYLSRNHVRDF